MAHQRVLSPRRNILRRGNSYSLREGVRLTLILIAASTPRCPTRSKRHPVAPGQMFSLGYSFINNMDFGGSLLPNLKTGVHEGVLGPSSECGPCFLGTRGRYRGSLRKRQATGLHEQNFSCYGTSSFGPAGKKSREVQRPLDQIFIWPVGPYVVSDRVRSIIVRPKPRRGGGRP